MHTLQTEQSALHERLAHATDRTDIAEAGRRLKAVEAELAEVEERWLAVAETIEALEREAAQADADATQA